MYRHFFQILNTGVIRKIIPSQPLRAREVEVLCSKQIETFDINLGQGSLSVNSKKMRIEVANSQFVIQRTTSKKDIPLESKDSDGYLSHRQSLPLKRENPTKPKPIKEA